MAGKPGKAISFVAPALISELIVQTFKDSLKGNFNLIPHHHAMFRIDCNFPLLPLYP